MSNKQGWNHGGPGRPGFQRAGRADPMNPDDAKISSPPIVVMIAKDTPLELNPDEHLAAALEFVKREKARKQAFEKLNEDTASRIEFQQNMQVTPAIQQMRDAWLVEAGKQLAFIRQFPDKVPFGLPHRAHLVSLYAHAGQQDKLGIDYSFHPQGVVQILKQSEEYAALTDEQKQDAVVAAYLHDVVEDAEYTGITLEDLRGMGFTEGSLSVVDALSTRPGETKDAYYVRVMQAGPIARAVKLADLGHNNLPSRRAKLAGAPGVPVEDGADNQFERLRKKYVKAYKALDADVPEHLETTSS